MRLLLSHALTALLLLAAPALAQAQEKVVKIYNWSDYIDPGILKSFTEKTGIKVIYDVYDSNDILETKLLAGNTGYDLVVPSSYFLARQIQAGIFKELDWSKIPNRKNLDPKLMERVAQFDPGNKHAFIYMWGTTGFAFNVDKIKERMPDAPVDSWRMLFDPAVVSKFKDCGVYMLDAADEAIPAALNFLGLDPNSTKPEDLDKAKELLLKIRPNIAKFNSSEGINALANGDICLAQIYSGDAGIAKSRAEEAKNGVKITYTIPKEGTQLWFDMMAMPKDAPDPEAGYAFMNYLLQPEIIAKCSDFVTYPNAVPASRKLMDPEVADNPKVYPPQEILDRLYVKQPYGARSQRLITRIWQTVTTGG